MQLSLFVPAFICAFFNVALAANARSNNPAIIMVPGAFHSPQVFDEVKRQLAQANYKFLDPIALPSVGQLVGRQPDIDAVKSVLCEYSRKSFLLLC